MRSKNKIKNYLKTGILLFGITFVISSCITDDFQMNEEENNSELIVKTINLERFNSKKEISKKLKLLSTKYDINKPHNKSNINSNDGSFTILTDEILEVSKDSITTTYTFRIETPTDTISEFENFMIEQKNDTLEFFLYKFKYNNTYPDFFPYETTVQNVDENQINSENFNEYLKNGYEIGGDGCLYYHADSYFVHYSPSQAEYYGMDGFWVPASDELIICAGLSSDGGGNTSGSDGGETSNSNTNSNSENESNNNGGGTNNQTGNNPDNNNNNNNIDINDAASFVVLPPRKAIKTTDCNDLHEVTNSPYTAVAFETLKNPDTFSSIMEKGYFIVRTPTYPNMNVVPAQNITNEGVVLPLNANIYNVLHSHPHSKMGMFSLEDIHSLYTIYDRFPLGANFDKSKFTIFMTIQNYTYAIKIDDPSKLANIDALFQNELNKKEKEKVLKRAYNKAMKNNESLEKVFLETLATLDLGTSLYKTKNNEINYNPSEPITNQTSNWEKLTLDNNNVKPTKC